MSAGKETVSAKGLFACSLWLDDFDFAPLKNSTVLDIAMHHKKSFFEKRMTNHRKYWSVLFLYNGWTSWLLFFCATRDGNSEKATFCRYWHLLKFQEDRLCSICTFAFNTVAVKSGRVCSLVLP